MAKRIGVIGGSGYTGVELLRILHSHPETEVVLTTADSNAGAMVGELYPSLQAAYPHLAFTSIEAADLDGLDLVFVALPHGASQAIMPGVLSSVPHVVDLGADFRLPPALYKEWYGEEHTAPDLQESFAF